MFARSVHSLLYAIWFDRFQGIPKFFRITSQFLLFHNGIETNLYIDSIKRDLRTEYCSSNFSSNEPAPCPAGTQQTSRVKRFEHQLLPQRLGMMWLVSPS